MKYLEIEAILKTYNKVVLDQLSNLKVQNFSEFQPSSLIVKCSMLIGQIS